MAPAEGGTVERTDGEGGGDSSDTNERPPENETRVGEEDTRGARSIAHKAEVVGEKKLASGRSPKKIAPFVAARRRRRRRRPAECRPTR